ncbi:2-hydroxyacyl-CoA dehydratase family protein [Azospirillum sp. TSO22-1]|uniref:2-hydroxyacyl-CoA dehydratase family protein n=1 Tax=Azospirillum sp. TSO22-1 TaxID=716789 RepID=UPI000D65AF48|nr:2-hydroxyacyl-CoA dehydratase family protein [Azospirillum sp. TSO22-1]
MGIVRTQDKHLLDPAVRPRGFGRETSEGLRILDELAAGYTFDALEKLAADGQSVIWGGQNWDSPLVYACDTIPVSFEQLWAEESRASEAIAEDLFQVPSEFCSMAKAMLGRLHVGRAKSVKRILHFGSGCEPIHSILELTKRDGYDVQTIDTVSAFKAQDKRDHAIRFLVTELERIAVWLTGKPVDHDRVAEQIHLKNTALRKVHRVLELRSRHPFYIAGEQTKRIFVGSLHQFGKPQRFIQAMDLLIEELEAIDALGPEPLTYIPIVLAGSVGNVKLFEAIEESNAGIVGWVYFGSHPYREDVPPLEALAHFVLDAQSRGDLGEGVGSSVAYRRNLVEEEVRKTGARGVISSSVTGCPYASLMQQLERDHFKKVGIPIVTLETDVHKEPPTEEQITRVKAFIEMLA